MTLENLSKGQTAKITAVGGDGALRQHFLDMGVIPGGEISFVKYAPLGDPMEFMLHGYELTLRKSDAKKMTVSPLEEKPVVEEVRLDSNPKSSSSEASNNSSSGPIKIEHPGLGEGGKFHQKEGENPLPEDTVLTFALVGNQNCGKTTLFNRLTGANQHVGNFPGVTVDRKDGAIIGHPKTSITDLPGIYSMSPYSSEEMVSRNFVLNEKPNAIINIMKLYTFCFTQV